MTPENLNKMEQIKKSTSQLIQARPAYESIIPFYQDLYLAQEESKQELNLSPVTISQEQLKFKQENELPLIDPEQFLIDVEQATLVLKKICLAAQNKVPGVEESATRILAALGPLEQGEEEKEKILDTKKLFNALIQHDPSCLEEIVKTLEIPEEHLVLLSFAAISPAIEICAEQLSHYLEPDQTWAKGYCPVCGSFPRLGYFKENGEKHLICGFCMHHWKTSRTGCALCLNREKDQQQYFYSQDEKEYRVDLCNHCKKYLKMIDLRELPRTFHPQLELIATLHLDMKALDQGYSNVLDPV